MSVSQQCPIRIPASFRPPSLWQIECQGADAVLILLQVYPGSDMIGLYH